MNKISRKKRILNGMFFDFILIVASYMLAIYIKYVLIDKNTISYAIDDRFLIGMVLYSAILPFIYYALNVYDRRFTSKRKMILSICLVDVIGIFVIISILYICHESNFSRVAIALFVCISTIAVLIKNLLWRKVIEKNYKNHMRNVVVVGNGELSKQYQEDLKNHPEYGYQVSKVISIKDNIEEIISKENPDDVVIAIEPNEIDYLPSIISAADKEGVHLTIIPTYNKYIPSHPTIEPVGNSKLINLRATPMDNIFPAAIKRFIDICGALFAIICLSPIYLFCIIGVKLSSPGPIFFKQERVGKDKVPFNMLKFRSMRVNVEQDTAWSKNEDPRKTKFGSFIRKYSLDELPQFINVLKGDMSMVGPRPEIPYHVNRFKDSIPRYLVRQQVRPGITGWAQVNGLRGDTPIKERVEYDIWYIENWSLWLDIQILFKTVFGGEFKNEEVIK